MTIPFDESSASSNGSKKLPVAIVVATILIITGLAAMIVALCGKADDVGVFSTDPGPAVTMPGTSGNTDTADPTVPTVGATDPTPGPLPSEPSVPTDPTAPTDGTQPVEPTSPEMPTGPSAPNDQGVPTEPTAPTEPEDDWIEVGNGDRDPDGWLPLIP